MGRGEDAGLKSLDEVVKPHNTQKRAFIRIQLGQLVHDLGTVPQNGMELQEAVQSLLQTIQFLIG